MKYFKEGRSRQFKAYVPLTDEDKKQWPGRDFTHLKISLEYHEGGQNYFSGCYNKRGFRVCVTPVSLGDRCESYSIMGERKNCGGYIMIEEAKRYNAGRLAKLAFQYDDKVPAIAAAVVRDDVSELIALVQNKEAVTV